MITFLQFLDEQEKRFKTYGIKTGHSPAKLMSSVVRPSKPTRPTYTGLGVTKIYPVPKIGK
jgi:hypothetical protein